jgi:hypothetical protein
MERHNGLIRERIDEPLVRESWLHHWLDLWTKLKSEGFS